MVETVPVQLQALTKMFKAKCPEIPIRTKGPIELGIVQTYRESTNFFVLLMHMCISPPLKDFKLMDKPE
ncbi:unnamed protein product [Caretta caretta]